MDKAGRHAASNQHLPAKRSATLFELVIITILMLIFITITLVRVWELRTIAEQSHLRDTLISLRVALSNEMLEAVVHHHTERLAQLDRSNPMTLLEAAPTNYLGEFDTAPETGEEGSWFFKRTDATLCYRVKYADTLVSDGTGEPTLLRFQVRLEFADNDRDGRFDPAVDTLKSLNLNSLQHYQWLDDDGVVTP